METQKPAPPVPKQKLEKKRFADSVLGICILLPAVAIWLSLLIVYLSWIHSEKYRYRTDLDMPDWFVINFELILQVLPVACMAMLCLLVSVGMIISCWKRSVWWIRFGLIVHWLSAAGVFAVGLLQCVKMGVRAPSSPYPKSAFTDLRVFR